MAGLPLPAYGLSGASAQHINDMYEHMTLPNGLRLVFERRNEASSAAIGIWVDAGSRNETAKQAGCAHFIEHMLFKGTSSLSASELAARMDALGGQFNAFTDRETTCFHARVISEKLDEAAELLADLFFRSLFREEDVRSERGVILEEMDMYRDTPEDLVVEQLFRKTFPGALGREVLGAPSILRGLTGADLKAFMDREYVPGRIVVALCGCFTDRDIARLAELFSVPPARPVPSGPRHSSYRGTFVTTEKATEQNHICVSWPGLRASDPDRFAWNALSTVLGGGMSSRLFQTVREKHGLCYAIGSFTASFRETGALCVTTAANPGADLHALRLILQEARSLAEDGVSERELRLALDQIRSGIILAGESSSYRMNRLGSSVLALGRCTDMDELLERYGSVTREDVRALACRLFSAGNTGFSVVGQISSADTYREVLAG